MDSYEKESQRIREKGQLLQLESLERQIDSLKLHIEAYIHRKNEYETALLDENDPNRKAAINREIEEIKEHLGRHTEELDTLLKKLDSISQNYINEEINLTKELKNNLDKEVDPHHQDELNQVLEQTTEHLQQHEEKRDNLRETLDSLKEKIDSQVNKQPTPNSDPDNRRRWNFLLTLILLVLIGFGFFIYFRYISISQNPNPPDPPVKPPTRIEIENLQEQISVGERILAISEGSNAVNRDAFQAAKEKGRSAITKGDYQDAINALRLTRQESAREFYKNAPETLIYLNNAYIGDKPAYTIAVAAPISQGDSYGLGVLRGVALAQEKINHREGGIEDGNGNKLLLKVVLVDDQNTSNVKLAYFLSGLSLNVSSRNQDLKILGLIGHQTSDLTLKLGDIYQKAGLPVISPSATSKEIFGKFSYVHPVPPSTHQMARRLTQEIRQKQVIVFYDSEEEFSRSFGTEVCAAVVTSCELWNLSERPGVNAERVKREISDGSTVLVIAFNANKSSDNKMIASEIIEAVSKFNASPQNKMELFAGNALYDQTLLNVAKSKQVSIARVGPWDRDLSGNLPHEVRDKNTDFLDDNEELWDTDQVNWFTLMAYNATRALVAAIKASQSPPPSNVEKLKAIRERINNQFVSGTFSAPGALGKIYFAREGYVNRGNFLCLSRVGASTNIPTNCQPSESFPIK